MRSTNLSMKRNKIIIAFDEHYSAGSTAVYSATRQLTKQFGREFDYSLFCQGGYFGPRFDDSTQVKVLRFHVSTRGRGTRNRRRLRRLMEIAHVTEAADRWTSNLRPGEDKLVRLLFHADRVHAIVMFAENADMALRLSRIAHIYSGTNTPHLILVTQNHQIDPRVSADLEWLGVRVLHDGDQVILRPQPVVAQDQAPRPDGAPGHATFSFLEWEDYSRKSRGSWIEVDWRKWIDPGQQYPKRVRDIVLFIRPDWMNCGSGTTFESLSHWFRGRDALLIDVGIWPYARPFIPKARRAQIAAEQSHIGAALYFSARMTSSLVHVIRQLPKLGRWYPRTWTRQKLLQHALAAKPRFMRLAIRQAKVTQIYLNHYFTYGYAVDLIRDRPFFLDTHDIQAVNFILNQQCNVLTRRVDPFAVSLKDEMEIMDQATRLCFVAPEELELAGRFISEDRLDYILPLPNVVPCRPRPLHNPERLLMVASLNAPNVSSMEWFLSKVWPTILQLTGGQPPDLRICGSIAEAMVGVRLPGIKFVGIVDDLRAHYDGCDLVLLPVTAGSGVAIKTLEAVLHERAVLATRHALRGLPDSVVEAIGFENDPVEFAKLALTIIKEPERHSKQLGRSRHAAELLHQYPFYETLGKALDSVRLTATDSDLA
jgi:Glycosyl transferases group 1